jgi:ribosomal protein S18 acetylase RimI-like enzyme
MSNKDWNIRAAEESDIQKVMALYKKCTVKMNHAGLFNWHENYPDLVTIRNDIQTGTLYILETDHIHGAVALNDDQPPEYVDIKWEHHEEPFLVVHRLAISPDQQGKGYGIKLMDFAEELAASTTCPSIRMDVYTINTPGRKLYQKLNYTELNEFFFPGFDIPFVGLEKKIY